MNWPQKQKRQLKSIIMNQGVLEWKKICNIMNLKFPSSKRNANQCIKAWQELKSKRQKKCTSWTQEESQRLFQLHSQIGNKWRIIVQNFPGKNQRDLKNHFFSSTRKKLRKLVKSIGIKNSTNMIKTIKPSTLCKISTEQKLNSEKLQLLLSENAKLHEDMNTCKFVKDLVLLIQAQNQQKRTKIIQDTKQRSIGSNDTVFMANNSSLSENCSTLQYLIDQLAKDSDGMAHKLDELSVHLQQVNLSINEDKLQKFDFFARKQVKQEEEQFFSFIKQENMLTMEEKLYDKIIQNQHTFQLSFQNKYLLPQS